MRYDPVGHVDYELLEQAQTLDRVQPLDFDGITYLRFSDKHHSIPRGTVVLDDRVVPGYPQIGRIFALEQGIRRNFSGPFSAEEKIDGYNVRVVRHHGRLLGLTRGGFVCPFTTDRLPELANLHPLFDVDPDLVICAEVAGPGNPYVSVPIPRAKEDIAFFAFDLMQLDKSEFVALERRDELFGRFEIPRSPVLGHYQPDQIEQLKALVLQIDGEGTEGIVFKALDGSCRTKYVTPRTNLADIMVDAPLIAELPESFFQLRLLRLMLGIAEFDLEDRVAEIERQLGHALVSRLLENVQKVRAGGVVADTITIRLRSENSADAVVAHMNRVSRTIKVREVTRKREEPYTILTLQKTYLGSTSRIHTLMSGTRMVD